MNRKGLIIIVTPTLLLIFVFFWLDMFQQNDAVSDRQTLGSKQENGLKSILAWTTRHEKILPGTSCPYYNVKLSKVFLQFPDD